MDAQIQTPQKNKLHPILWVAAVAVTLLSLAGIGAIMGVIPHAGSNAPEPVAAAPAQSAIPPEPTQQATQPAPPAPAAQQQPAPVQQAAPVKHVPKKAAHADKAITVAKAPEGQQITETAPAAKPAPICRDCGVIDNVRAVEEKGEGTGLGAVAGGVLGGVLGHQVGGGRGKDLATVAGAVGGAVAGHQVEKNVRKVTHYEVTVRYDDGTTQVFKQDAAPTWRSGDRVKVVNGVIMAAN